MKIDKDASGTIEVFEMLMHFDIERTPFTKRVFSIFDDDGSGTIDFREFVMAMWNYCTLGKATLVLFAFDLYDRDNSGEIDKAEIRMMLKDVYGSAYNQVAYILILLFFSFLKVFSYYTFRILYSPSLFASPISRTRVKQISLITYGVLTI
jgi:serine/threonine-protein phosphatase 2B regulatory subunit